MALGRCRAKLERLATPPTAAGRHARRLGVRRPGVTRRDAEPAAVDGFVGGTVHVIVNNWIGFTTEPHAYNSTRFASDAARRLPILISTSTPKILTRWCGWWIATDYRPPSARRRRDLIGYRRYGPAR